MFKAAKQLAGQCEIEVAVADGLLSVDIVLRMESRNVAIEVNGPHHYSLDHHRELNTSLYRYRLLKQWGWQVVVVPFWDESHFDSA